MRLLALLLSANAAMFLSVPALADDLTMQERFADCMGPRALARAKERFMNAPCQGWEAGCGEFESLQLGYLSDAPLKCATEAYVICWTKDEGAKACESEVSSLLSTEISRVQNGVSKARLDAVKDDLGFSYRRFVRYVEAPDKVAGLEAECDLPKVWPIRDMNKADWCDISRQMVTYMLLINMEKRLKELEGAD